MFERACKRGLDICVAAAGLLILSPLLALLATMVGLTVGAPVLFRQERLGRDGRSFSIYKFRTMTDERDAQGNLLPEAVRLTAFGRFLRLTSLDELPELFNVIRGEMSLVGPRPFIAEYRDHYSPFQARRHEVRPGITGWAQINGRNALDWQERIRLDVWYVDNWNLLLDLRIFLRTIPAVLHQHGVNRAPMESMPRFDDPDSSA